MCVSDRVLSKAGGGVASSETRGHVGDPVLATHWIPLSPRAQAVRVTVREERALLRR